MNGLRRIAVMALALLWVMAPAARGEPTLRLHVSRTTLAAGETAALDVVVTGATGAVGDPELRTPEGIEVLSSGRSQDFSWVNGRTSSEVVFRYQLAPATAGRFTIGPVRVRVGAQTLASEAFTLRVSAAPARIGAGGAGPATLRVDIEPASPYVGQPVVLRVRLVLRAPLAEDPQYVPPSTPGFWSESPSPPESYYAAQGNARVQVTETRMRLYPLAAGTATIGEASAVVAFESSEGDDPMAWIGGRVPRREVTARSAAFPVAVRALPAGAPAGFDGAVGTLTLTWTADRARTSRDVPITVRLDVRGEGNLPLLHTPPLDGPDVEVFASTVEDSLGAPGAQGAARRRFQWTVLPRREGELEIAPPALVWFDPRAGGYRMAPRAPIRLHVDPPLRDAPAPAAFPRVFSDHPSDPGARPAMPWGWALGGLALGAALALWRAAARPPVDAPERARQREWLRAVGLARGPDFWRAADEAGAWLEGRGGDVRELRRDVATARFGGVAREEEAVRRRVVERLGHAMPLPRSPWGLRAAAFALAVGALVMAVACAPRGGGDPLVARVRAADARARAGDVPRAAEAWEQAWREGGRDAALAARLAWVAVRDGQVGPAAAWVLRGQRGEPRDPGLAWVTERVREGGGLVGAGHVRTPLRSLEWAVIALALGLAAGAAWPRRGLALALAALALAAAAAWPGEEALARRAEVAVVRAPVQLAGAGVGLEAGQVVHMLAREGARVRVSAGRGLEGLVDADGLLEVEGSR